jgi:glycosyltransferase involved in cell wall biosynthesis
MIPGISFPSRRLDLAAFLAIDGEKRPDQGQTTSANMMNTGGTIVAFPGAEEAEHCLTLIVPAYNEAEALPHSHAQFQNFAGQMRQKHGLKTEIIYVNDGSRDGTSAVLATLAPGPADIRVISFARNFGKEAALLAGLELAKPGAVLFMDADGQHPTSFAEKMVDLWLTEHYDVVYTYKAHRRDEPKLRVMFVGAFYALLNFTARHKIPADGGDFRLLSPRAAEALRLLPERNRFFKGLSSWIGFRQVGLPYEPEERRHGTTKWSFFALLGLSLEGLTSFSVVPLRLSSLLGFALALCSFGLGLMIIGEVLIYGSAVPGYPSLLVGVMFIGGVQLLMIGIVGEYIGKILSELKGRPVYIIAEDTSRKVDAKDSTDRAVKSSE